MNQLARVGFKGQQDSGSAQFARLGHGPRHQFLVPEVEAVKGSERDHSGAARNKIRKLVVNLHVLKVRGKDISELRAMTLHALSLAAAAFRRNPYPFAATGAIALALNLLGLIHPILSTIAGLFVLPMLYVGLGTLAEAEPGLRFTQALRLALSAWPRTAALGGMMFILFLFLSTLLGISLSALYGDELMVLAQTHESDPAAFSQALLQEINWSASAFGLAALVLLTLGLIALIWMAPFALVYHNMNVLQALRWSVQMTRPHFAALFPALLLWVLFSGLSGALVGLNIILWPFTALFHFYCFRSLGKQAP